MIAAQIPHNFIKQAHFSQFDSAVLAFINVLSHCKSQI